MATPNISNLNNRTAAVLKVVGMYLATLLLLFLIFISSRQIPEDEINKMKTDFRELRAKDSLRDNLFVYLDTLSALTKTLVSLDSIQRVDPSANIGEYTSAEAAKDYYVRILFGNLNNMWDKVSDDSKAVQQAYQLMLYQRDGLKKLRRRSNTSLETQEDMFDLEKNTLEEQIMDLKARNTELLAQIAVLQTIKVDGGSPATVVDCTEQIKQVATLTGKAARANSQLELLKGRMQAFEDSKSRLANRQQLVIDAINEIGQVMIILGQ